MLNPDHPIVVDVCKDRTLSVRYRQDPPFNGVAIPVMSAKNQSEAKSIVELVGTLQYEEHPLLSGQKWYKLFHPDLHSHPHLDREDLPKIRKLLAEVRDRFAG